MNNKHLSIFFVEYKKTKDQAQMFSKTYFLTTKHKCLFYTKPTKMQRPIIYVHSACTSWTWQSSMSVCAWQHCGILQWRIPSEADWWSIPVMTSRGLWWCGAWTTCHHRNLGSASASPQPWLHCRTVQSQLESEKGYRQKKSVIGF